MNIIKQLRQEKGVTQEELGKILNVQKATISKYETGRVMPDVPTILKMANFFNVSIYYLLGIPENNSHSHDLILSDKEREIIYKYRFLSPSAKGTVELILENQYENEKEEKSREKQAI